MCLLGGRGCELGLSGDSLWLAVDCVDPSIGLYRRAGEAGTVIEALSEAEENIVTKAFICFFPWL